MSQRTAQIGLFILCILAVLVLKSSWSEVSAVLSMVAERAEVLMVDTGVFYMILATLLFPIVFFILFEKYGNSKWAYKYVGKVIIVWFIISLVLANILPIWLESHIENKDYILCATRDRAITTRGHQVIYQLPPCDYKLLSLYDVGTARPWEPVLYK